MFIWQTLKTLKVLKQMDLCFSNEFLVETIGSQSEDPTADHKTQDQFQISKPKSNLAIIDS